MVVNWQGFDRGCAVSTAAILLVLLAAAPGRASEFDLGDWKGGLDSTLAVGAAWRVQSRDPALIGIDNGGASQNANGDNGNLNYGKGLVAVPFRATEELTLAQGNFGFFGRVTALYDPRNDDPNNVDFKPLSHAAIDQVGRQVKLLDAYGYGSAQWGGITFDARIGQQVLNWGEAVFIPSGLSGISPLNIAALHSPGAELRNALVPVPITDLTAKLMPGLSLEAFYQWGWKPAILDPAGTYFSTNDLVTPGGAYAVVNATVPDKANAAAVAQVTPFGSILPRSLDRDPSNWGEYGAALRWTAAALNDADFGLYFVDTASRLPLVGVTFGSLAGAASVAGYAGTARYYAAFPAHDQTAGLSVATSFGDYALAGEYSLKFKQPFQIQGAELIQAVFAPAIAYAAGCRPGLAPSARCDLFLNAVNSNQVIQRLGGLTAPTVESFFGRDVSGSDPLNLSQAQFSLSRIVGGGLGADQIRLIAEAGMDYVQDMPSHDQLRLDAPGLSASGNPFFPGTLIVPQSGFPTAFSWGYRLRVAADYLNAIGSVSLTPVLAWSHDVAGTTPTPISNFIAGRRAIAPSILANYQNAWSAELGYVRFFGGNGFDPLTDRDYLSLTIKRYF